MGKRRNLTAKQRMAIELLTGGEGLTYKEIAERVQIDPKNLYLWRTSPEFAMFQAEYNKVMDAKWLATIEAARQSAFELCKSGNQKMVEFVLKNDGLNPTQKVEADINTDIVITIDD